MGPGGPWGARDWESGNLRLRVDAPLRAHPGALALLWSFHTEKAWAPWLLARASCTNLSTTQQRGRYKCACRVFLRAFAVPPSTVSGNGSLPLGVAAVGGLRSAAWAAKQSVPNEPTGSLSMSLGAGSMIWAGSLGSLRGVFHTDTSARDRAD